MLPNLKGVSALKAIILVIDGMGVGAMDDVNTVRPQDKGTNTLKHVLEAHPDINLPTFQSLGAGLVVSAPNLSPVTTPLASYGKCNLAHEGADTFQGHQEIVGSLPNPPAAVPFRHASPLIRKALERAGYRVEQPLGPEGFLLVNSLVIVADNIEGEPFLNYNVTAPLDYIPFEEVLKVGTIVRQNSKVSRVIVLGGTNVTIRDILAAVEKTSYGALGVNCTKSGVYRQGYMVRHLGNISRPDLQVTGLARKKGLPVTLIGKAADVLFAEGAVFEPCVETEGVMKILHRWVQGMKNGLIVANVQETDLAGHSMDSRKWATKLAAVDAHLPLILGSLLDDDLLIITGDHGNDPVKGNGHHTREKTLLLAYGRKFKPCDLGERSTLADIGATVASYLGLGKTEAGSSFLFRDLS